MLHQVITTEKVPITYRVAGIGSRFLAWLADAGLIALLAVMGIMAGGTLNIGREGLGDAIVLLWIFALRWGYFLVFEWLWSGQTPGKRLVGIRVIQSQGRAISFLQAAVRNLVRVVDALPFFYALGFVVAACDCLHRRLGDLAADTIVVHLERRARAIQALPDAEADPVPLPAPVRQRLGTLDRGQKQALLDLCLRRDQLPLRDRVQAFAAAAAFLETRLGVERGPLMSDEKFILQVAARLGERTPTGGRS